MDSVATVYGRVVFCVSAHGGDYFCIKEMCNSHKIYKTFELHLIKKCESESLDCSSTSACCKTINVSG